jgi:hypothetical protein
MQITKKDIIQKLYEIEENNEELKLGREVQKVVRSETIPIEVIKLINKYDKSFLQIYDTYNTIYNSRNKNPLYRNLRNPELVLEEKAIAISSLVTKILISCSKIPDEQERLVFANAMNIDQINIALTDYAINGIEDKLLEVSKQVRELLELLYVE